MASSRAGLHQKANGALLIVDDLASGDFAKVGAAEENFGGTELDASSGGNVVKVITKTVTRAELNALGAVTTGWISIGVQVPANTHCFAIRCRNGGTAFTSSGGTVTGINCSAAINNQNGFTGSCTSLHSAGFRSVQGENFSGQASTVFPFESAYTPYARFTVAGSGVNFGNLTDGDDGIIVELFYVEKS